MSNLKEQVLRKLGTIEVGDGDFKYVIDRPLLSALADVAHAADGDQFAQSYRENIADTLAQLCQLLDTRGEG